MQTEQEEGYVAFEGHRLVAAGSLPHVALKSKQLLDKKPEADVLIFADVTGELIDVDFRGTAAEVEARLTIEEKAASAAESEKAAPTTGPGRPRLGVVAREVTLLPRHWEWLASQPGGASVALRKLVEDARRASADTDRRRLAKEACYRFMQALAGNLPLYEEANRALFAGQRERFIELVEAWPHDVREHAKALAARALE